MITIISHDAGGAEILSSYVKNIKNQYLFCLSGPAIDIFNKKINKLINRNLNFCLKNCNEVIASTGVTDFEKKGVRKFIENKKKSTVILDHWCNYKRRFLFNNKYIFPDEIWVTDNMSYIDSKKIFKKTKIKKIKNYYLIDLKKKFSPRKNNNLVFLWTPVLTKKYPNLDRIIFKEFYEKIYLKKFRNINLIIRPHPSEHPYKYKDLKKKYKKLKISKKKELLQDLQYSKVTFGFNSMATYISNKLGVNSYNIVLKNLQKNIFIKHRFSIKNVELKLNNK